MNMNYAIIKLGNKQHRVRDGETLVVDRVAADEGKSFQPTVLLGEGKVTATVVAHERGPKIRIGKYRRRTGYRRHNGFRAATSRIQISLGATTAPRAKAAPPQEAAAAEPKVEATTAAKPEPTGVASKVQAWTSPAPTGDSELPDGYDELTVAEVKAESEGWSNAQLEAALAHEQVHAARKGAIAALESALAKEGP
jgi:large subunit ribosomal protein L21